jgi:hypothetical protein
MESIWWRHNGGVSGWIAHFRVSRIERVRGTHNIKHKVVKSETPFWVKSVVMVVITQNRGSRLSACSRGRNF